MKKTVLLPSIAAVAALVVLAGYAASGNSTAAAFSSPEAAARAVGNDGVLIEVLHARVCRDAHRHGERCSVQEISGRVISAGKGVSGLRPGDCVGFRGEITPCGECSACRAGHRENCRDAGRVCDPACRSHNGRCRNRLVTQECNLVRFSGGESISEQFARLCAADTPCPRLRCHETADSDAAATGNGHCRGRGHGRHCR